MDKHAIGKLIHASAKVIKEILDRNYGIHNNDFSHEDPDLNAFLLYLSFFLCGVPNSHNFDNLITDFRRLYYRFNETSIFLDLPYGEYTLLELQIYYMLDLLIEVVPDEIYPYFKDTYERYFKDTYER